MSELGEDCVSSDMLSRLVLIQPVVLLLLLSTVGTLLLSEYGICTE